MPLFNAEAKQNNGVPVITFQVKLLLNPDPLLRKENEILIRSLANLDLISTVTKQPIDVPCWMSLMSVHSQKSAIL